MDDIQFTPDEEFIKDMIGTIEMIYEKLDLSGFSGKNSTLNEYVNSISDYRKNNYDPIPEPIRIKIAKLLEHSYYKWDY